MAPLAAVLAALLLAVLAPEPALAERYSHERLQQMARVKKHRDPSTSEAPAAATEGEEAEAEEAAPTAAPASAAEGEEKEGGEAEAEEAAPTAAPASAAEDEDGEESDAVREAKELSEKHHGEAEDLFKDLVGGYHEVDGLLVKADHQALEARRAATVWAERPPEEFEQSKKRVVKAVTEVTQALHEGHAKVARDVKADVHETLKAAAAHHHSTA